MARKQLNLSLTLEQYGWLEELAEEAGETPTKYARVIVLDRKRNAVYRITPHRNGPTVAGKL